MTKKTASGSGCTFLSLFYRSPRLMLGLSLLSGFSILSSGFVIAQTDSLIDTGTAPSSTSVKAAPAPAPEPPASRKPVVTTIIVPDTSAPRANRQQVAPATPPAPVADKKPVAPSPTAETATRKPASQRRTPETALKKPSRQRQAPETAQRKPPTLRRTADALGPIIAVPKKPILAAPDLSIPDSETVATPPKLYLSPTQTQESAQSPDSPTNRYIDRTDYNIGATDGDEKPTSVVLSDRSTGCRTVSQNGQLLSGSCGVALPHQPTAMRQRATRDMTNQPSVHPVIANRQTDNLRHLLQEPRLAKVTTQALQLARLATQDGSLSKVTTQEPQLLGVKRLLAPAVASTKLVNPGSVRLRLRGIQHSRQKSYSAYSPRPVDLLPASSFSFPEASTSPGGQSYYNVTSRPAGRPNVSNANFMFPLAIPNAITSLFGWRIHPIAGDYRFHAGTDIGAPEGTPVLAAVAGQIITADFMGGYGLTVVVQHQDGKNLSLYGHLSEIFVQPGEQVEQGNVIGRVGTTGYSTGPHL
ncbi:MAG TPA: peptidoglycan DD-metalloendopeptidase family protein, partial [Stenomitos sp.]